MNKYFLICSIIILAGCTGKQKPIVQEKDFQSLLTTAKPNTQLQIIQTDIKFWSERLNKNRDDISSQVKLASLYNKRFQYSGAIADVQLSDRYYFAANQLQKHFGSGLYRSLAANCVTQHKFKEADLYLDSSASMGDDIYLTRLQQFDVKMELGQYYMAENILKAFAYKNTFDYYLRLAKLEDHKGNGAKSIQLMEQALAKALETKNEHFILWVKTNLADMYGHHNRIAEAYRIYLDVLNSDAYYYHAWKGIAWVAFSADKNTATAKQILYWLKKNHPIPDYDLLLAEIADFEKNIPAKEMYMSLYLKEVSNPSYGNMYNKYVFALMSDEQHNFSEALRIAQTEVSNRPTPQSYDLLAWTYYKTGHLEEANKIATSRLINQNYEPNGLFHLGVLFKYAGNKNLAKNYLKQALESSFELGPHVTAEIKKELKTL